MNKVLGIILVASGVVFLLLLQLSSYGIEQ